MAVRPAAPHLPVNGLVRFNADDQHLEPRLLHGEDGEVDRHLGP